MATVSFTRSLVPSEFLQLAQAVWEQNVRQFLVPEAGHVLWVLQLQLRAWWTGRPAVGRRGAGVGALLTGQRCGFTPGAEKKRIWSQF